MEDIYVNGRLVARFKQVELIASSPTVVGNNFDFKNWYVDNMLLKITILKDIINKYPTYKSYHYLAYISNGEEKGRIFAIKELLDMYPEMFYINY